MKYDLSYDFGDHFLAIGEYSLAFRVWTLENVYGVDANTLHVAETEGRTTLDAEGVFAAGGQVQVSGTFHAEIWVQEEQVRVTARARHPETIKCIGIVVKRS